MPAWHTGAQARGQHDRFVAAGCLADDADAPVALEQRTTSGANEGVPVGDQHADCP